MSASAPNEITVVDEGSDYLLVDKPPGLLVHPTKPGGPRTLRDQLRELLAFELASGGQISFINRLDRETSGLVLVAKNARAAREFNAAMAERQVRKRYHAILWGWPAENEFRVDAPLLRLGSVGPSRVWLKQGVHPSGATAATRFVVTERFRRGEGARFALAEVWPETGRTHQIRVHAAEAGHPVVGDKLYGPAGDGAYLEFIRTGWTPALEAALLLPRHALHASGLGLRVRGEDRWWEIGLPADLVLWRRDTG